MIALKKIWVFLKTHWYIPLIIIIGIMGAWLCAKPRARPGKLWMISSSQYCFVNRRRVAPTMAAGIQRVKMDPLPAGALRPRLRRFHWRSTTDTCHFLRRNGRRKPSNSLLSKAQFECQGFSPGQGMLLRVYRPSSKPLKNCLSRGWTISSPLPSSSKLLSAG